MRTIDNTSCRSSNGKLRHDKSIEKTPFITKSEQIVVQDHRRRDAVCLISTPKYLNLWTDSPMFAYLLRSSSSRQSMHLCSTLSQHGSLLKLEGNAEISIRYVWTTSGEQQFKWHFKGDDLPRHYACERYRYLAVPSLSPKTSVHRA